MMMVIMMEYDSFIKEQIIMSLSVTHFNQCVLLYPSLHTHIL